MTQINYDYGGNKIITNLQIITKVMDIKVVFCEIFSFFVL